MSTFNKNHTNLAGTLFIALLLSACAGPKVKQNVLMPANSQGMQNSKKVAVIKFSGDRNGEFSSKMETFFSNVKVKNKPYFTVVDQNTLNSILTKQKIHTDDGIVMGDNAVQLGKLSGADTLISGFVKWPNFTNKSFKEKRTKCVKKADEKSKGLLGIKYRKCVQEKEYMVSCNKLQGEFNFTLKAVSLQSGEVVHTKNYKSSTENKYCSDNEKYAKKEPAELEKLVMAQAIGQMRKDVAPYTMLLIIELMDDDDSDLGDNKHAIKLFESGIEFSKNNRMSRACSLFSKASEIYQNSPAVYHNLGVCAEMKRDFGLASSMYKKADSLLLKPKKIIDAALVRVSQREQKEKFVNKQLR